MKGCGRLCNKDSGLFTNIYKHQLYKFTYITQSNIKQDVPPALRGLAASTLNMLSKLFLNCCDHAVRPLIKQIKLFL